MPAHERTREAWEWSWGWGGGASTVEPCTPHHARSDLRTAIAAGRRRHVGSSPAASPRPPSTSACSHNRRRAGGVMQTTEVRVLTLTWVWHARQKLVLERWTNPKLPRRTCSCEYGLQSCRGKSAGSAKRPRERSPTRNPLRFATLFIAVSPVVLTRALPCRKTPTRAKGARGVLFDQRLLVQHPHAHGRNAMGRGGFSGGAEDLPQATGASGGHLRENSVWGGG